MQSDRKKSVEMILQFALCNLLFAILIFLAVGCSSVSLPSLPWSWSTSAAKPDATAEALYEEGMAHFANKKYALAVDRLQRVKAEFPFSPQLVPAELKLAEAYYLNKQYPEAAAAFKEFQTLHPTNENIPFVLYHLGLVYFDQFTNSDRDQKTTEIAKGYFASVVKDHSGSPYADPAKEKLAKCVDYLSEHEFNIALFYFNEKKYPAATDRLEDILRRYRETSIAPKALYYLAESYRLGKNNLRAALAYEALIQHYAEDPLAKKAQVQLAELSREKQDPLATLLKKEGRPALAALRESSEEIQNRKSKIENRKELNLVAKKEVVHEEPGEEKGMFRRVVDILNPFSSSSDKKKKDGSKIETAKESSPKTETSGDPQLLGKIDESLNRRGIDSEARKLSITAPASNLPAVEEATAPPSNTAELLGKIDSNLKKEGRNADEPPPVPEVAAIFKASNNIKGGKPAAPGSESASPSATQGLIAGIDQALKQKGIEPAKVETTTKTDDRRPTTESSGLPSAVKGKTKIELAPKLAVEKGPLFLDTGEYQAQEKAKAAEASEPVVTQPTKSAEARKEIPQAVVKGPQPAPAKEKISEAKVADRKQSPDEEDEPKGALDKLREDINRLGNILNPFGW